MVRNFFMKIWLWLYLNLVGTWKALEEQIWNRHRKPRDLPRGEGKNIVITGGNRGIGYEAVKTFLSLGYHVILGCRDTTKCEQILEKEFEGQNISGSYKCIKADLTSLDSVRAFAQEILDLNVPIHILVNNAGIMFGKRRETKDGFESQMGVNFLSHFLLTSLLLPKLKEAGTQESKARIFNVTSVAHHVGSWLDFDDLQGKKFYSPQGAYGNSKAAQVMFTRYLNGILSSSGENVLVNCAHPGVVNTGLYEHARYVKLVSFMMKSPAQGGDCILHGAISPNLNDSPGGLYIENSRPKTPNKFCRDINNQKRLWDISLKLVGLEKF